MKITIEVPEQIRILAEVVGATPEQLIGMFAYDLAHHVTSGGSDERMMAKDYFMRTHWAGFDEKRETVEGLFGEFNIIRYQWGKGVAKEASDEEYQRAYDEREADLLNNIRQDLGLADT